MTEHISMLHRTSTSMRHSISAAKVSVSQQLGHTGIRHSTVTGRMRVPTNRNAPSVPAQRPCVIIFLHTYCTGCGVSATIPHIMASQPLSTRATISLQSLPTSGSVTSFQILTHQDSSINLIQQCDTRISRQQCAQVPQPKQRATKAHSKIQPDSMCSLRVLADGQYLRYIRPGIINFLHPCGTGRVARTMFNSKFSRI